MSTYNLGIKTFTAGGDLAHNTLVALDEGAVVTAAPGETPPLILGVATEDAAEGAPVGIRLANCAGTVQIVAAAATTTGAVVELVAGGKIQDLDTGQPVGITIAGASKGALCEVMLLTGAQTTAFGDGD